MLQWLSTGKCNPISGLSSPTSAQVIGSESTSPPRGSAAPGSRTAAGSVQFSPWPSASPSSSPSSYFAGVSVLDVTSCTMHIWSLELLPFLLESFKLAYLLVATVAACYIIFGKPCDLKDLLEKVKLLKLNFL